jgi:hypothetical protein
MNNAAEWVKATQLNKLNKNDFFGWVEWGPFFRLSWMRTAFSNELNGDGFFKWVEWERLFQLGWLGTVFSYELNGNGFFKWVVGSPFIRGWYGSRSTSSHEHALYSSEMKWYDFLKLVRTKDLLIRILFRVQWVVLRDHVLSTWFRFMPESMNRHWHLFKKMIRPSNRLYNLNISILCSSHLCLIYDYLIYWRPLLRFRQCWLSAVYESVVWSSRS